MGTKNVSAMIGILILLSLSIPCIAAQSESDSGDYFIYGFELDKILSLLNGCIALVLAILTFIAYKTDGRSRFFYISLAFFIFSIKSFLVSSEILFSGLPWRDPLSIVLEFLVLLAFFYGVTKKRG